MSHDLGDGEPEKQTEPEKKIPTAEEAMWIKCPHETFAATVSIARISKAELGPILDFQANIRIECEQCGTPFHFKGVEQGMSYARPMASVDGLELRAPIRPGKVAPMPVIRFEVNPEMVDEEERSSNE